MSKIFVSTYPFSRTSSEPEQILKMSGFNYSLNPLGKKLTAQELYDLAGDATAIIAGTEDLSLLVEKSKNLKLIARIGIGLDSVPLELCKEKGIKVCYTPDAVTDAVAEMALGMIISLNRKFLKADIAIRNGGWERFEGKAVKEQTIGIIGFGRIGQRLSELLIPFKPMKILVYDILNKNKEINSLIKKGVNITQVDFEDLIKHSDTISIHTPKTPLTTNLINRDVFQKMKDGIVLINTARGGIINEIDLIEFLESQKIMAAGLDVFSKEPYKGKLISYQQVLLTQHMGSCSFEARKRMEKETAEDVVRFLRGERLLSPVNLESEIELIRK